MADDLIALATLNVSRPDENRYVVEFGMSDEKRAVLSLTEAAAHQLVSSLQLAFLGTNALTLHVQKSTGALTPEGERAIVFETKEAGRVAIAIPEDGAEMLIRQLGEIRAQIQISRTKQ